MIFEKFEFCARNILMEIDFLKSQCSLFCLEEEWQAVRWDAIAKVPTTKKLYVRVYPSIPRCGKFFGTSHCTVPENIHTETPREVIRNSKGWGFKRKDLKRIVRS